MFSFTSLDWSSFLGQWYTDRVTRRRGAHGRSHGVAGEVATLESRRMLAGTTAVTFAAGVLTLTCADDLTQAGILAGKNDNVITLTGGAVGAVTLGGAGEVFTGALGPFAGVTQIKVFGKEGADNVTLNNVNITGAVTVTGGSGANTVSGTGGSLGSLSVTNLDGADSTDYSNATIVGAVAITNGDGGLLSNGFGGFFSNGSSVAFFNMTLGSVSVSSLEGYDEVNFGGTTTVNGTTTIMTGVGGSGVFTTNLTKLSGALSITNADGFDYAILNFVSAKAITITNGNGGSYTSLSSTLPIVGNVSVTNLAGNDNFSMGGVVASKLTGNLTISNGNGGSYYGGGSSTDLKAEITGNVSVSALAGHDRVSASNDLKVTGTTTFSFGTGASDVNFISGGTLDFGGALSVTSADGDDEFRISSPNPIALKNVTLSRGNGDSTAQLEGTITGNLSLTSLAGRDDVLAFGNLKVTGTTTMNFGSGDSDVNLLSAGTLNFGGALTVTSADGNEHFNIASPKPIALKNVSLSRGNGNTTTNIAGAITGNLSLTSLAGNDEVSVFGNLSVTGTTTFNFGNGNSDVAFNNPGPLNFGGALSVTSADGDDRFTLNNGGAALFKAVTINTGLGGSQLSCNPGGSLTMDALSITGGSGFHNVGIFGGATVTTKNVTLNFNGDTIVNVSNALPMTINGNLSATITSFDFSNLSFGSPLNVTGTTTATLGAGDDFVGFGGGGTLTGAVTVTGNAGADGVSIQGMTVVGNMTTTLGTGDDIVRVDNSIFKGTVTLTLGAGDDRVEVEQQDIGTKTLFEKTVTVNAGAGYDRVLVGLSGDANDFAEFLFPVTVNGGAGIDQLFAAPISLGGTRFNIFTVAPVITGFEVIL